MSEFIEKEKEFWTGAEWKLSYVKYDGAMYERWERLTGKRHIKWKSREDGWLDGRFRIVKELNKLFDQNEYWLENLEDIFCDYWKSRK